MGGASCVTSCMSKAEGYSAGCAGCMGTLTGCTKSNCMMKCLGGQTPDCVKCVTEHCTPAFKTCSGVTPPTQPDGSDCPKPMIDGPLEGACLDTADKGIWDDHGKANFATDLKSCILPTPGDEAAITKCFEKTEGYSPACADCCGKGAICVQKNCLLNCIGEIHQLAVLVLTKISGASFKTCSGLDPPTMLVQPEDGACMDDADHAIWESMKGDMDRLKNDVIY
eukprot:UN22436